MLILPQEPENELPHGGESGAMSCSPDRAPKVEAAENLPPQNYQAVQIVDGGLCFLGHIHLSGDVISTVKRSTQATKLTLSEIRDVEYALKTQGLQSCRGLIKI